MSDTVDTKAVLGGSIMSFFPLATARPSQRLVIEEIENRFSSGIKIVILEAPVGSGKSAIAMTFARRHAANPSRISEEEGEEPPMPVHVLTPSKALQTQYHVDFPNDLVTMRGRASYPCTTDAKPREAAVVFRQVRAGNVTPPKFSEANCRDAPCQGSPAYYKSCVESNGHCPYTLAIEVAQESSVIVHNLHSFICQTNFSAKFKKRSLMIVDECHEIEGIVRDFAKKKFVIQKAISEEVVRSMSDLNVWIRFLTRPENVPEESDAERAKKLGDPAFKSLRDEYMDRVSFLESKEETYKKGFSVEYEAGFKPGEAQQSSTILEFVPKYVGAEAQRLILSYGERILLMSGTIYDKAVFCRKLGINPADAAFIRIPSTFPVENRPIYLKPQYQVDTSFAKWNENFGEMVEKVETIMNIFKDDRGIIHAPSYMAGEQLANALGSRRILTHNKGNFLSTLHGFFESETNQVLISPNISQGVDFKEDRARFQIVLRVPYMSTQSKFAEDMVQNSFQDYNYEALVVFGQQCGRVNRSEDDYGATFLMDSRFQKFIMKNKNLLPQWLLKGMIYK
jgi:Rad3-related DNA helicase